jgi:hypothetical protein
MPGAFAGVRGSAVTGSTNKQLKPETDMTLNLKVALAAGMAGILVGCAFDLVHVNQVPVTFTPATSPLEAFVLRQDVKATLGTGFPTRLKSGTQWRQVGATEYGRVFTTKDQIVTVEASNISEAQLVVSNQCVTGFYLPVEKKFAPVSKPIRIETEPLIPTNPKP